MQKLFAMKDTKAQAYGLPFAKPSLGEAERAFIQARRDKQSVINQFPEDFELYDIGTFDPNTGKIVTHDSPRHMLKASDILAE